MSKHTSPVDLKGKKRDSVFRDLDAHRMTAVEAAQSLGITERQVWRLLAAFRQEGADAVVHGNRGRMPVQTLSPEIRQRVIELAQTKYVGFNQTHFTEKLRNVDRSWSPARPSGASCSKQASAAHNAIGVPSIAPGGNGDHGPA